MLDGPAANPKVRPQAPAGAGGSSPDYDLRVEGNIALPTSTILAVDDEPDILESLRDILEACGPNLRVLTARNGRDALDILRRERVDLILSDYKMPGMDGLEFLAEKRKLGSDAPAILITAFPDLDVAIKAINEAGIEHFITKPFSPGTVIEVARSILQEQRAQALRSTSFERSLRLIEAARDRRGAAPSAMPNRAPSRAADGKPS